MTLYRNYLPASLFLITNNIAKCLEDNQCVRLAISDKRKLIAEG